MLPCVVRNCSKRSCFGRRTSGSDPPGAIAWTRAHACSSVSRRPSAEYSSQPVRSSPSISRALERRVVRGTVLPVVLVDREDVVGVESAPVQLPKGQSASGPAVAVGERVDGLEPIVDDRRGDDGRQAGRGPVPPREQFRHERGHVVGRRWAVLADPDPDRSILALEALVHDAGGQDAVERQDVPLRDLLTADVLLDVAQSGEVVQNLALRARC